MLLTLIIVLLRVASTVLVSGHASARPPFKNYALLWGDEFIPCAVDSSTCVNGGIQTADWDFDIGDGSVHGSFMAGMGAYALARDSLCIAFHLCTIKNSISIIVFPAVLDFI